MLLTCSTAFAIVLPSAPRKQQSQVSRSSNQTEQIKMIKCVITIRTASKAFDPIEGLFKSTIEAAMHALAMVNEPPYIKVKVLK